MMKQFRSIIIAAVVLAMLVAGGFLATKYKNDTTTAEPTAAPNTTIKLFETASDKVTAVQVKNDAGDIVIEKEGKGFKLVTPAGLRTNNDILDTFVTNYISIIADKVVENEAKDLSLYGFPNSKNTVSVTTSDKKTFNLELGDMNPTKDGYYLREKDSNKIYLIASYSATMFQKTKADLVDLKLFTIEAKDLVKVGLDRNKENIFMAKRVSDTDWKIISPIEYKSNIEVIGSMAELIPKIEFSSFVAENVKDLKKYGLETPNYGVYFETKDVKAKLLIGNADENGAGNYVMLEGTKTVYTADISTLTFLDKTLMNAIEQFAFLRNIQDIKKFEVDFDGKHIVCETTYSTDKNSEEKFTFNGTDVTNVKNAKDDSLFKKFYQGVIGNLVNEIDLNAKPSGKAEITYKFYYKTGSKVETCEFISKNKDFYYVVVNKVYMKVLTFKKNFDSPDGLRTTYKNLVDAMKK